MNRDPALATSAELLERAQAGDGVALNELLALYLPRMRGWVRGRIPAGARGLLDTEDVVQETVIGVLRNLHRIEQRGEGALQAYMRRALFHRLTDLYRSQRPPHDTLQSEVPAAAASPLELAIGQEALERYERALANLASSDQEAIILRVELCCGYDEIAAALRKPNAEQARVAVSRALARLAREMRHERR